MVLPPASTALCIADLNHDITASLYSVTEGYVILLFLFFVFLDAAGLKGETRENGEE